MIRAAELVQKYKTEIISGLISKTSLAKQLVEEGHYKTVENARSAIRKQTGTYGKLSRGNKTKIQKNENQSLAKILLFDIETSPFLSYAFSKWNPMSDDFILKDSNMICWSAKWLFDEKIYSMKITPKEQEKGNDKRIAEGLWKMFDDADVIVAHNLKKFDKKIAQSSFIKHGLNLPSHYQEIDTLLTCRKQFKEVSNRLDYWTKNKMGIEGKKPTSSRLWVECSGDPFRGIKPNQESIDYMSEYCDHDVKMLEDLYLYLRPYITNHPNVALFTGSEIPICKACGHTEFDLIGEYTTIVNRYQGYRCKACGSVHRSRKAIEKSNVLLR